MRARFFCQALAAITLCLLPTAWGADVASAQRPAVTPAQKPDVSPVQKPDVAPAQNLPKYEVIGFRDARFGMTEAEIRALATKSFGIKDSDMTSSPNLAEGTTVLTVRVPSLDPGPGPATIAYIFGAKSKKLIQVNVVWGDDDKAPADANAILGVGSRLERYFAGFSWKKDATRTGVPVGDNTVVLFAGEDEKKGAVRLVVDGVKYQAMKDGSPISSPDPKGPPKLIINYIADRDNPDVATIDPGKF